MPLDDTMRDLNFCDMTPDKTPSTSNGCSGQSKPTFMATNKKFLFSLVLFLEALVIAFALMERFPPSGDDYSYLYQAKLFASGELYAQDALYDGANPLHNCVGTSCIADNHGRRFSKYPPGWPAFLALGALTGTPWLIDPILGAILVFLILRYVGQRMGENLVNVAGTLLILCLFVCYYTASLRAHIACALFVFAAFLAYDASQQRPQCSRLLLFGAGALLGYSSMIRYLDWIPLAAWIGVVLARRKMFTQLTFFAIGFGLLATGNLLYDTLLSGHPLETPTALNHSPGIHDRLMVSWTGLQLTGVRLVNLLWVFPPALLLVVLWKRYQPSSKVNMYLALFLMNVGIYAFYPAGAGGPGPRYLLAYFPFLILAVVDVRRWINHDCGAGPRRLWRLAIILQIVASVSFVTKESYASYWRRDLQRTVRQTGHGRKIFFLETGTYPASNIGDLTRNPPVLSSAKNLYFIWCNQLERDALLRRFPGRKVFVYEYPGGLHQLVHSQPLRSSTTKNRP